MSKLLFIVDVQKDFVTGSLAVPDAAAAVGAIEDLAHNGDYDSIWASKDFHPSNHFSFSTDPEFKDGSWPHHCVAGTFGSAFAFRGVTVTNVFYKGKDPDVEAYSAFDGENIFGTSLNDSLVGLNGRQLGRIEQFDIVGLATDYCVKATAIDAAKRGWNPTVLLAATRPVHPVTGMFAVSEMAEAGVRFA